MKFEPTYDVIIIGGSYSGLAAAMALGRALFKVLIIDSGKPCNAQTPYSHNFLTRDGETPAAIAELGRAQVAQYQTVSFLEDVALKAARVNDGFEVGVATGKMFTAKKLIFATGIRDMLPAIGGLAECWGISILHCPFCHGYEVRNEKTGIIGNGAAAYELATLISNWTRDLHIFTNGPAAFTEEQRHKLANRSIGITERVIVEVRHEQGYLEHILFADQTQEGVTAVYLRNPFRQVCPLPELMGCALTDEGYIQVDAAQATSIPGIYACGDNATKIRTVAKAVAAGTTAGMTVTRQLISEQF